ncbi:MAG: hypothetical protein A3I32_00130 [Candidatus Yanofskybacteria bacterium RIFCSPLOWO2_02_FULL_45_10]|uniref:Uncharacterized protein n=2 Tax=Candidatus Yanofskyibacteriota TaxID=1752733 RepID=A0A1F8G2E9_9BACT|nr:MAG: hypothetical protein A3F25_02600 [Candidatus Yanofskybacteria bacterium RIFCSPHIGHO2_12_FULL_45_19b]OGN31536.1 MAG: hypothetical protein A3I32_00130 [Candidatus Yanofskybacteria bacterium RIFCSPLOWO2_02_FULL_45_10]
MDDLNSAQKEIGDKIARLLAESPLDPEIKNELMDGLDRMPEAVLSGLLESLEKEHEGLKELATDIASWEERQDEAWQKLTVEQKAAADKWVDDEMVQKLTDEAELEEVRQKITE